MASITRKMRQELKDLKLSSWNFPPETRQFLNMSIRGITSVSEEFARKDVRGFIDTLTYLINLDISSRRHR